jgi:alpha-D-ribose 1-methylphosphonate 5-triphosphate synthase subunit PhnG
MTQNSTRNPGRNDVKAIDPERKAAMAAFAEATAAELTDGLARLDALPGHTELRAAETGLVMVRGRIGGDGAPFNLGEATVTRAAVQLSTGEIGYSYALGRDAGKARLAALCDALWQSDLHCSVVQRHILLPVRERLARERAELRARTAATRVDFFTLVRGENAA